MDTSKKIIRGVVNSQGFTITSAITQWDYGWQFIPEIDDLPPTYRLDFSNEEKHGTALPVYCGTDGAEVPTELIDTGKDVWVWFVRIGDGFGITEYKWRVPNKCKPKTEQDEPTPSQQSSIDQLIVRSNEAVETAEEKAEEADTSARSAKDDADRAEQARDDAQTAQGKAEDAQESAERAKDDAETSERNASESERKAKGYADTASEKADAITGLTATATTLPDGSSATASYDAETGVMSFGIPNGKDGTNGTNGDDGYSPTASVSQSGKTTTITITDQNGTTSAQVEDGTDGTDGISPTVTITPITGGHRITITDADGEHSADVMDGTGSVDDVQINGSSIVTDGVANVPYANTQNPGVVKVNGNGLRMVGGGTTVGIDYATEYMVKAGVNYYNPIVPALEGNAIFYGLSKAAGDTTQSQSSNAVGNYTDDAKAKIQSMLGFGGFELIKTVELTEDSANIEIDTDEAGNAFRLTEFFFAAQLQPSDSTTQNTSAYVKNNQFGYYATLSGIVRKVSTNVGGYTKNIHYNRVLFLGVSYRSSAYPR